MNVKEIKAEDLNDTTNHNKPKKKETIFLLHTRSSSNSPSPIIYFIIRIVFILFTKWYFVLGTLKTFRKFKTSLGTRQTQRKVSSFVCIQPLAGMKEQTGPTVWRFPYFSATYKDKNALR